MQCYYCFKIQEIHAVNFQSIGLYIGTHNKDLYHFNYWINLKNYREKYVIKNYKFQLFRKFEYFRKIIRNWLTRK